MITRTNSILIYTRDDTYPHRYVYLVLDGTISIDSITMGDKVFTPFKMEVDGEAAVLPLMLEAGMHVIELMGMKYEREELRITGNNLEDVIELKTSAIDPCSGYRSGTMDGVEGENTITFRKVDSTDYFIRAYGILTGADHIGEMCNVTPLQPPNSTDSREATQCVVVCDDECTIYWSIEPYVI